MLEITLLILTIAFFIIVTAMFISFMRGRVDNRDYVFHKIWYLILYASLKTEVQIGYGIAALESRISDGRREHFSKYPIENPRVIELRKKEFKLREMKEQHLNGNIPKRDLFNLKILK